MNNISKVLQVPGALVTYGPMTHALGLPVIRESVELDIELELKVDGLMDDTTFKRMLERSAALIFDNRYEDMLYVNVQGHRIIDTYGSKVMHVMRTPKAIRWSAFWLNVQFEYVDGLREMDNSAFAEVLANEMVPFLVPGLEKIGFRVRKPTLSSIPQIWASAMSGRIHKDLI